MSDKRKLEIMENIAVVAQDSAESGNLDSSVYAGVFEYIADGITTLIAGMGGADHE